MFYKMRLQIPNANNDVLAVIDTNGIALHKIYVNKDGKLSSRKGPFTFRFWSALEKDPYVSLQIGKVTAQLKVEKEGIVLDLYEEFKPDTIHEISSTYAFWSDMGFQPKVRGCGITRFRVE